MQTYLYFCHPLGMLYQSIYFFICKPNQISANFYGNGMILWNTLQKMLPTYILLY